MTGAEITDRLRLARATVARRLRQAGIGRLKALEPKDRPQRRQRERPSARIRIDIKNLGRLIRIGHRITGDRTGQSKSRGVGWGFLHVAIEDATRLAYVKILPDEKRDSATGFLVRARGARVERVRAENGSASPTSG